jgi:hypothetical protein
MSPKTSASASCCGVSGPGRARYSDSTPTRIAPACSGNANSARAPAATAAGTKPGHRSVTSSKSGISIGDPNMKSSVPGPSPVVNSSSSSRTLSSPVADSGSRTPGPLTAVTLAPSTASQFAAARHSAASDTGASPSRAAAIHAHTRAVRSPATSPSSPPHPRWAA